LCPESIEHKKIKEIVLGKLKEMFGTGLNEYPHGGHINDVYVTTSNFGDIFVENIWTSTKRNFEHDLIILHRSPANTKILIVNPQILKKPNLCNEFEKTRMSETGRFVAVSNMIDGSKILNDQQFVDEEFPRIVRELVKKALSRISITPSDIVLSIGEWQTQSTFKVHNRTDEVYYEIWVKLIVEGLNVTNKDIEIEIVKPRDEVKVNLGKIEWSADIARFNGTDETGNSVIYLLIASLNPKDTVTFFARNRKNMKHSGSYQTRLVLTVAGLSQKPASMVTKKNAMGKNFTPPEKFKLESVSFRLKKTSETF
jgi:hypothetical protein